jgi:hypothetical protein
MNTITDSPASNGSKTRISEILERFLASHQEESFTIGELATALGKRAFGASIFMFALANLLLAWIPGMSFILPLPIIFLSVQIMFRKSQPWVPQRIGHRRLKRKAFADMIQKVQPTLRWIEKFMKPRLATIVDEKAEPGLGLLCLIAALILILPIPGGNFLPAMALLWFALGIVERDGYAVLVGLTFLTGAAVYLVIFSSLVIKAVMGLWNLIVGIVT